MYIDSRIQYYYHQNHLLRSTHTHLLIKHANNIIGVQNPLVSAPQTNYLLPPRPDLSTASAAPSLLHHYPHVPESLPTRVPQSSFHQPSHNPPCLSPAANSLASRQEQMSGLTKAHRSYARWPFWKTSLAHCNHSQNHNSGQERRSQHSCRSSRKKQGKSHCQRQLVEEHAESTADCINLQQQ